LTAGFNNCVSSLILTAESSLRIQQNTHRLDLESLPTEVPEFRISWNGDAHLLRAVPFCQKSTHSFDTISFAGICEPKTGIQPVTCRLVILRHVGIYGQTKDVILIKGALK